MDSGKFGGAKVTTGAMEAACTTTQSNEAATRRTALPRTKCCETRRREHMISPVKRVGRSVFKLPVTADARRRLPSRRLQKSTPIEISGRIGRVLESRSDGLDFALESLPWTEEAN